MNDIQPESGGHLVVEGLNLFYGGHHVLKDINISIPRNRITVILGPSGCGKTSFLRTLTRLHELTDGAKTQGRILLDGSDILALSVEPTGIRRRLGLLAQHPCPLPMSVYDNVAYGPRLSGIKKKKELDPLVEFYLKEAGLWSEIKSRLHSPAVRLSLGQQQRLCLARGLAVKPEVILGDEPTSALDPVSSRHIEQKFIELKNRHTIVIVTHILRQARRFADYVVFLYAGEVVEHGTAKEFFENPRRELTRDYIQGVIS